MAAWADVDDEWLDDPQSEALYYEDGIPWMGTDLPDPEPVSWDPESVDEHGGGLDRVDLGRGGHRRWCLAFSPPEVGPGIVYRIIQNHRQEVRACYNRALSRDPTAAGRVVLVTNILVYASTSTRPSPSLSGVTTRQRPPRRGRGFAANCRKLMPSAAAECAQMHPAGAVFYRHPPRL